MAEYSLEPGVGDPALDSSMAPMLVFRQDRQQFGLIGWRELLCVGKVFFIFGPPAKFLIPHAVKNEFVRPNQQTCERVLSVAERTSKELRSTADDPMCCLKNDLHRPE